MFILISFSFTQTKLASFVTNLVNNRYSTDITVERLKISPYGDFILRNVLIKDHHKDTLIFSEVIEGKIDKLSNLLNNGLFFSEVKFQSLDFNLINYRDEKTTNIQVFGKRFSSNKPKKSNKSFTLETDKILINNSNFKYVNHNLSKKEILNFNNLSLNASSFNLNGININTNIEYLSFHDYNAPKVDKLTCSFSYRKNKMIFNNLSIQTPKSSIEGNIKMLYDGGMANFMNKVNFDSQLKQCKINLGDINYFYDKFNSKRTLYLDTKFQGVLNDFILKDLTLFSDNNSILKGDFELNNIFNKKFKIESNITYSKSSFEKANELLKYPLNIKRYDFINNLKDFEIKGRSFVNRDSIVTNSQIKSNIGIVKTKLSITDLNKSNSYKGTISFIKFNVGKLFNVKKLKNISLNLNINGRGFSMKELNSSIKGNVSSLIYNNYNYKEITLNGKVGNYNFNGDVNIKDENIELAFKGKVDFSKKIKDLKFFTEIKGANLKALNFTKKDSISELNTEFNIDLSASSLNDITGDVNINEISYLNEHEDFKYSNVQIYSRLEGQKRLIETNKNKLINGSLNGEFKFSDLNKLVLNSISKVYNKEKFRKIYKSQYVDIHMTMNSRLLNLLHPNISAKKTFKIDAYIDKNIDESNIDLYLPDISYKKNRVKNLKFTLNNSNPIFNSYISIDSLITGVYNFSDINIINKVKSDSLFYKLKAKGGKTFNDEFNLNFVTHTNEKKDSFEVLIDKSDIVFNNCIWKINESKSKDYGLVFSNKFKSLNIINPISIENDSSSIQLYGNILDKNNKDLFLDIVNLNLSKIIPKSKKYKLDGVMNSKIRVYQKNGKYLPILNLDINDLIFNETEFDNLSLQLTSNSKFSKLFLVSKVFNDTKEFLNGTANLDISTNKFSAYYSVNDFDLNIFNLLSKGVIEDIEGKVTGEFSISNTITKPNFSGSLFLNEASMSVPYLNVNYSFKDLSEVILKDQSFSCKNISIRDTLNQTSGNLIANVTHDNFSNWDLLFKIKSNNLMVLNTTEEDNSLYYGTAFMNGECEIVGPSSNLNINLVASTAPNTVFKIPLSDTETYGGEQYMHFVTREEKIKKSKNKEKIKEISGLDLNLNLDINQNANLEILVDKDTGSTISGNGNGVLLFQINTNGKFEMFGDYIINKGNYNFTYKKIIEKKFDVTKGYLSWNGSPYDAQINIQAMYKGYSNPSVLLDSPINRSIPVNVLVDLNGSLSSPNPDFKFSFPSVNSTIRSELDYRLENKETRETQALSFLATGTFISDLSLGQQAYGTVSDRVSGIVNSLITNDSEVFNLGLNYESGEVSEEFTTDDRLGLTLSTKITDRVYINGKVGVPVGGVTESVIAGDVQIDLWLNDDGSLTAKFFNREDSIRNFGDEIGYTQGVGISYNLEFNTFKEFVNIILKGKKNK